MKKNQCKLFLAVAAFAGLVLGAQAQSYNTVMTIAEAPTQTNSTLADTLVEDFNSLSVGDHTNFVSAIGTYDKISILAANQYGGAAGPGYSTGSPYAVASTSGNLGGIPSYTLTFNNPVAYFGLWWSAGDPANTLTFYDGTTQVAYFTTGNLFTKLNNKSYFGNPTPGSNQHRDGSEGFAFLNFYALDSTLFTSVVFGNTGNSGFENDNNTIRTVAYGYDTNDVGTTLPGVPVEEVLNVNGVQTILTDTNQISQHAPINLGTELVPEPGMNALFALGGMIGLAVVARRRSVKA